MKQEIPWADRPHIGVFGRCNSGKSSLVNALARQTVAIVSDVAGTTTDVVRKSMEMPGVGACVLVDTAGFDDRSELGALRMVETRKVAGRIDVALLAVPVNADGNVGNLTEEKRWLETLERNGVPVCTVLTQSDRTPDVSSLCRRVESILGVKALPVSARCDEGLTAVYDAVAAVLKTYGEVNDLTAGLVNEGDTVLLVMPQDVQAPKGRLILPQVQTLRNLLDKHCCVMSCPTDRLTTALQNLTQPPSLIITDSQVFGEVSRLCPPQSRLTSFSVLFARYKGDIQRFMQGAAMLQQLAPDARILIAEACTHVPQNEDIGRVKLPALLRKRLGNSLRIEVVSGNDFPADLTPYDLVIHCGACMFTRRHVMARLAAAQRQGVAVTNYGIAIAALTGILDQVAIPE